MNDLSRAGFIPASLRVKNVAMMCPYGRRVLMILGAGGVGRWVRLWIDHLFVLKIRTSRNVFHSMFWMFKYERNEQTCARFWTQQFYYNSSTTNNNDEINLTTTYDIISTYTTNWRIFATHCSATFAFEFKHLKLKEVTSIQKILYDDCNNGANASPIRMTKNSCLTNF